eukprot:CAMPEP_0198284374 /NCGR_PEP_ID=MMETSP1449-20131203/3852_1 /TAXON_ID=420275 /ORGANISM="Attheya septentrionalis, Strain CCMP2084" /LENGTH=1014 /DNA_ID=CAMNT_0043981409 /DNA_START=214 /DNA_END=3258 /DNA_ORIENTATION=-
MAGICLNFRTTCNGFQTPAGLFQRTNFDVPSFSSRVFSPRWHSPSPRLSSFLNDGREEEQDTHNDSFMMDDKFAANLLQRATRQLMADEKDPELLVPQKSPERILEEIDDKAAVARRMFMASALLSAGVAIGGVPQADAVADTSLLVADRPRLQWEASPVNKRSGVTVFDAEKDGYNVRFVTYLTRFLLCFDEACQRWWYSRASDIPRMATADQVDELRLRQFAAFSASVEVGLQEYRGPDGPAALMDNLLVRYCPDQEYLKIQRDAQGLPPLSASAEARQQREIKEARRQIALLFGLMQNRQPVEKITKVLAAIDNGCIEAESIEIQDPGSGYAPGYGAPRVTFPSPEGGSEFETARGRAILRPSGKILRIDLVDRGIGYAKPPTVKISLPEASFSWDKFDSNTTDTARAEATVFLFRDGINKGRVERIQLTNPGSDYAANEKIKITISPPELSPSEGGKVATAKVVLEYEVGGIEMVKKGSGYAAEKPLLIDIEPPPLTARVNMNDPMISRVMSRNQLLPRTTIPSANLRSKMPDREDPSSVSSKAANAAASVQPGGCIGRGCYDKPVVAIAKPRAEKDSYTSYMSDGDGASKAQAVENAVSRRSAASAKPQDKKAYVSGSLTSEDGALPPLPFWGGGPSSSAQLLSLLPAGVGLAFDPDKKRYKLNFEGVFANVASLTQKGTSSKPIDPEFGPRGRSPIERVKELDLSTLIRFCASGAICCSGVHLALTPIDVVKTKIQTNPVKYTGVIPAFNTIFAEGGMNAFFTGWAPTFLGFFVWGGLSYPLTEFLRRYFEDLAGAQVTQYEVPIILASSAIAAVAGSGVIAPFEAVRIRSVAQPDFAPSITGVLKRMIDDEGVSSLFSAVPVFLVKEIPFAMAKFTVFDLSTAALYDAFPAAREDLRLSLFVSLAGGTLGGISAAIVSNPADATISELKKSKSDMSPMDAFELILERAGVGGLFKGLVLRMFFYSLIVSCQFLVYDAVRFALGIGTDDLKLYLDVLGGALRESGGPV